MAHPVTLVVTDDLERSRLTVFFRGLLVIPHVVWLLLWSIPATLALIAAWLVTLFTRRVLPSLHDFLADFLRSQVPVYSYLTLVADPFPSFSGSAGYPVTVSRSFVWAMRARPGCDWSRAGAGRTASSRSWEATAARTRSTPVTTRGSSVTRP